MKKLTTILLTVILFCTIISCGNDDVNKDTLPDFVKNSMTFVWSDEFEQKSDEPNPEFWDYNVGGSGWGNSEIQTYTMSRENSYVSNGTLKIIANKNDKGRWQSARLITSFKKNFTYGYIEFRAKLPTEAGSWPALWMMPQRDTYGKWPRSGEIDVMEYATNTWGKMCYGTCHCFAGSGDKAPAHGGLEIKDAAKTWHTYAVNWTEDKLTWYIDGVETVSYDNPHSEELGWHEWPYDKPFYIIMNVAMGGTLGGDVPKKLKKCQMEVDWVRVYQNK